MTTNKDPGWLEFWVFERGKVLILEMLVLFFSWDVRLKERIRRETAFDKGWVVMLGKEEQM